MPFKSIALLFVLCVSHLLGKPLLIFKNLEEDKIFLSELRKIGLPDSVLKDPGKIFEAENILTTKNLKRAEMFTVNLTGEKSFEQLVQFVLQNGEARFNTKAYILILKDKYNRVLKLLSYETMLCEHVGNAGLTFRFSKTKSNSTRSILFDFVKTESCGNDVQSAKRTDTLTWVAGVLKFTQGQLQVEGFNKMQMLDEIEK